ncbi:MAG: TetR/AcrR family transcriptional regulator [Spirulinaceae cyanobacterium SM2_1_0]|nr:TetR/AcrR family transcriptional regulator [Spirulinaceae cyanobacterium SM2_1_0]
MSEAKSSYHHGDLRQALIDGAIAEIAAGDPSQLSLRAIARRVGVSHAAPYRHFADKEALLAAVAEEGFCGLTAALTASFTTTEPQTLQQLTAGGHAYVTYALHHPHHYRVMFSSCPGPPERYPELATAGQAAFMVLVEAIIAGQAAGRVRAGDPMQLAQVTWSLVHGIAMLTIDGYLQSPDAQQVAELTALAMRSLVEGLQTPVNSAVVQ